jgi:hypothetical protein
VNGNANNLSPGTYSSTITFNNTSKGLDNTSRSATLTLRAPPALLSVAPQGLREITGLEGGPFTPTRVRYRGAPVIAAASTHRAREANAMPRGRRWLRRSASRS